MPLNRRITPVSSSEISSLNGSNNNTIKIDALREPLDDDVEIVVSLHRCFSPRQALRACLSVRSVPARGAAHRLNLQTRSERRCLLSVRLGKGCWCDRQGIPGNRPIVFAVHDGRKSIGSGLGTDPLPRELPPQQVFDERGLSDLYGPTNKTIGGVLNSASLSREE